MCRITRRCVKDEREKCPSKAYNYYHIQHEKIKYNAYVTKSDSRSDMQDLNRNDDCLRSL